MIDIKSFTLSLPSFIERSYYISPGLVSVIFSIFWAIFTFLVVTFFIQWGFAAAGIKEPETEQNKVSLWHLYRNYSNVQSVSNKRWGDMISNITSARVILGVFFWVLFYGFELLFSLSIDNGYVTHYNGTACVGRIDNFTKMYDTMLDRSHILESTGPPKNATLLRQFVNDKQVGNVVLLGDGIFAISPTDALYKKDQTINVSRAFFQCDHSVNLLKTTHGTFFSQEANGGNVSLPSVGSFSPFLMSPVKSGYNNMVLFNNFFGIHKIDNQFVFYILVSNPVPQSVDINFALNNSTGLLQECLLVYEYGVVTIIEDGHLNETNIGGSYSKVDDNTGARAFLDSYTSSYFSLDTQFFSLLDYPNELVDVNYNKTYSETMKVANNIAAAHLLNGLDPSANLCTFNQEQVPIYFSVLGTRMSFGYIVLGVAFVLVSLLSLSTFVFIMFSKEERDRWRLYSDDRRFAGYVSTGTEMDKKTFNLYAKNIYIENKDSMDGFQGDESDKKAFDLQATSIHIENKGSMDGSQGGESDLIYSEDLLQKE